jgi:outer membrane lipoprotein-sorting protein
MLPKQSMNFSPAQLLQGDYTSVFVRTEKVNNQLYDVVKIIPNSDTTDIILSTMWINSSKSIIHKVETTTKRGGTVQIEFEYDPKFIPLPIELRFSFNAGEMKIPSQNQMNKNDDTRRRNSGAMRIKGTVIMQYSNYKINTGLSDSLFEEKKK